MKITEIHEKKHTVLSFEIFPPKKDDELKNIDSTLEILCELKPDFISVTFGAGGSSNNNKTIALAKKIKEQYHVEPVVHLTCLCYDRSEIDAFTKELEYEGIQNVLALRGDRNPNVPEKHDFAHASELITYLKQKLNQREKSNHQNKLTVRRFVNMSAIKEKIKINKSFDKALIKRFEI